MIIIIDKYIILCYNIENYSYGGKKCRHLWKRKCEILQLVIAYMNISAVQRSTLPQK